LTFSLDYWSTVGKHGFFIFLPEESMFQDDDLWPILCPRCAEVVTKKLIGWLKQNDRLRCPECEITLFYNPKTFAQELKGAEAAAHKVSRIFLPEDKL
jgi:uncharacterized C2H2 Zn-finger protein